MSRNSAPNLRGVPMKPYDLLREGLIVFGFVAALVIVLAIVFGSPDYPTVRAQDVAQRQPIAYLRTGANILAGNSGIQGYGPPYTPDPGNAQQLLGVAPARWLGVTTRIDPPEDLVLAPLQRLAQLNEGVAEAVRSYRAAPASRRQSWAQAYLAALDGATVNAGTVSMPEGDFGPVGVMLTGLLNLGRAGLLEGALESGARLPYTLDFTRSLLFFQDDVDQSVAHSLDMTGGQWGISHETGPYPGAWWLWPYTFLYQIPPMSTSPNGDLQAGAVMVAVFLILLLLPFIPLLNRLPRWLPVYKLIWRDWYRHPPSSNDARIEDSGLPER